MKLAHDTLRELAPLLDQLSTPATPIRLPAGVSEMLDSAPSSSLLVSALEVSRLLVEEWDDALDSQLGGPGAADCVTVLLGQGLEPEDRDHPEARMEAVERLAANLVEAWRIPKGSRTLRRRMAERGSGKRAMKMECLRVGLLFAADDHARPQSIRIGQRWITDNDGRIVELKPGEDLDLVTFAAWFRKQALAAARAHLRELPFPTTARASNDVFASTNHLLPVDDALALVDSQGPSIDDSIDVRRTVDGVYATATPRQRDILDLLLQDWTTQEIATRLAISEATVRVQLLRLRRRLANP